MTHYKPAEITNLVKVPIEEKPSRVRVYLGEINGKACYVDTPCRRLCKDSQFWFRKELENKARLETTSQRLLAKLAARKIERAAASSASK